MSIDHLAAAREAVRAAGHEVASVDTLSWLRRSSRPATAQVLNTHAVQPVAIWDVRGATPLYRLADMAAALGDSRARPIDPDRLATARQASVVATVADIPVAVLQPRPPTRPLGAWLEPRARRTP